MDYSLIVTHLPLNKSHGSSKHGTCGFCLGSNSKDMDSIERQTWWYNPWWWGINEWKKEWMKEGRKEGGKEGGREGGKEGRKEAMKEGKKEWRDEGTMEWRKKRSKEWRNEGKNEGMKARRNEGRKESRNEGRNSFDEGLFNSFLQNQGNIWETNPADLMWTKDLARPDSLPPACIVGIFPDEERSQKNGPKNSLLGGYSYPSEKYLSVGSQLGW